MFATKSLQRQVGVLIVLGAMGATLALPGWADAQVPYDVIASGRGESALAPTTATLRVVRSESEFYALWHTALGRNVASAPDADFRNHIVIAYFLGGRPTSGYYLEAERVEIRSGTMTVNLVEFFPGACCGAGLTATMPEIWISTIPWKGPAEVEMRREPHSCCR